jgi:hypothetical protein
MPLNANVKTVWAYQHDSRHVMTTFCRTIHLQRKFMFWRGSFNRNIFNYICYLALIWRAVYPCSVVMLVLMMAEDVNIRSRRWCDVISCLTRTRLLVERMLRGTSMRVRWLQKLLFLGNEIRLKVEAGGRKVSNGTPPGGCSLEQTKNYQIA